MQIKRFMVGIGIFFIVFMSGGRFSWASSTNANSMTLGGDQGGGAPRITCSISMQFWCIIQANIMINMKDDGNFRIWSITSAGEKSPSVIIRENKRCDSPAEYHPKKISENDEAISRKGGHVKTFALTSDRSCTISVKYPVGNDDWARDGKRMAKYGLFACINRSCSHSLLDIP